MEGTITRAIASPTLPTLSYNSMGWNNHKIDFIRTLLITHGIMVCAVQEHFLLKQNLYKLDCMEGFEVFSIPAHKNNLVNSGRPSGGLALFYKQDLSKWTSRLTVPNSYRVQGLKIALPNSTLLFINAYFPNDPGNNNLDDLELLSTLQDIKYLLNQVEDSCTVVLTGDLNTDFSRNTLFVQIVKNFFIENNLDTVWSNFECAFTFYHERFTGGRTVVSKSKIDHFAVKAEDLELCLEATPLHLAENFSYHEPIYLNLKCNFLVDKTNVTQGKVKSAKKPLWYKASKEDLKHYSQDLKHAISNTPIDTDALGCRDPHCTSEDHRHSIDDMCHSILGCITEAVQDNIPLGSNQSCKNIAGWNQHVQPLKDDSIFWKAVWESAGRPVDTELHRVYKNCRNKYKYAIRKVRKLETSMRKNKFLDSCLNNKVNDILQEIKSLRSPNKKCANVVDGKSNSDDISNHFKTLYQDIYNTHQDQGDLDSFILENNTKISQSDLDLLENMTPELVKNIILKFSDNKNDSVFDWKSNALKQGADSLAEPICDLLRSLIMHGHIPQVFLVCSLIPIVKNANESKLSSSNYRLIAISSLLLKLFDHILINLSVPNLNPSIYQYGFQKGLSTGMCTWTLSETINYFTNRGSPVFMCLMDLTKAFDLVKLSLLFKKLAQKVAPILIRFLVMSYINQQCSVLWDGAQSSSFSICNGVRQGAVLSPTLFNIYIDSLFIELSDSGFGCKIKDRYFGCIDYADDISFIAPSREALQQMINIAKQFFDKHGIKISTNPDAKKTKTKILVYGVKVDISPLLLGNTPLPCVESWNHLGHTLNIDQSPAHDMLKRNNELVGKLLGLMQEFPEQDPKVMMKLIQVYLLSLYGSSLWDIYSTEANKLWSTWHRLIKRTFNLPLATHRYVIPSVSNCKHLRVQLIKRFINFYQRIRDNSNPNIALLHSVQSQDMRSVFGRNVRNICRDAGVDQLDQVDLSCITVNPVPEEEEWRIPLISDILDTISKNPGFLNKEELALMLSHLCTN